MSKKMKGKCFRSQSTDQNSLLNQYLFVAILILPFVRRSLRYKTDWFFLNLDKIYNV